MLLGESLEVYMKVSCINLYSRCMLLILDVSLYLVLETFFLNSHLELKLAALSR